MAPTRTRTLITGASSGLGAGMARVLAAKGRDLSLCARRTDRIEALADELRAAHAGIRVVTHHLDVRDPDQVAAVVHASAAELGGLDRVVVNAGIGATKPVGTGHAAVNREVVRTNFSAALDQCEAAMEVFRSQGHGHLVVISSVAAVRALPGGAAVYGATKAGLAHLAAGLRAEFTGTDIVVSTIYPGYIRTEMTARSRSPVVADIGVGSRKLVAAMEREPARAYVPAWPWAVVARILRVLPRRVVSRMG